VVLYEFWIDVHGVDGGAFGIGVQAVYAPQRVPFFVPIFPFCLRPFTNSGLVEQIHQPIEMFVHRLHTNPLFLPSFLLPILIFSLRCALPAFPSQLPEPLSLFAHSLSNIKENFPSN